MPWYANISKPSREVVLHLQNIRTLGREDPALSSPEELQKFLADHPELEVVNFYAAWMPRRAVPVGKITPALIRKLFRYK